MVHVSLRILVETSEPILGTGASGSKLPNPEYGRLGKSYVDLHGICLGQRYGYLGLPKHGKGEWPL